MRQRGFHTAKDTLTLLKSNGFRQDSIVAAVHPTVILISDGSLPIEDGDTLQRFLPSGVVENFIVTDPGYRDSDHLGKHFQVKYMRETEYRRQNPPLQSVSNSYSLSGPNSRVNISSTDNSVNIVRSSSETVFAELKSALLKVADMTEREQLLVAVDEMDEAHRIGGESEKRQRYERFLELAGKHMPFISPLIAPLTQVLLGHAHVH